MSLKHSWLWLGILSFHFAIAQEKIPDCMAKNADGVLVATVQSVDPESKSSYCMNDDEIVRFKDEACRSHQGRAYSYCFVSASKSAQRKFFSISEQCGSDQIDCAKANKTYVEKLSCLCGDEAQLCNSDKEERLSGYSAMKQARLAKADEDLSNYDEQLKGLKTDMEAELKRCHFSCVSFVYDKDNACKWSKLKTSQGAKVFKNETDICAFLTPMEKQEHGCKDASQAGDSTGLCVAMNEDQLCRRDMQTDPSFTCPRYQAAAGKWSEIAEKRKTLSLAKAKSVGSAAESNHCVVNSLGDAQHAFDARDSVPLTCLGEMATTCTSFWNQAKSHPEACK